MSINHSIVLNTEIINEELNTEIINEEIDTEVSIIGFHYEQHDRFKQQLILHELLINPDLIPNPIDRINDNDISKIPTFDETFGNILNDLTLELINQPPIYNKLPHFLLYFRNEINTFDSNDEIFNIINENNIQILINTNEFNIITFKEIINNVVYYIRSFLILSYQNTLLNNWRILSDNLTDTEIINYSQVCKQTLELIYYNINIIKIIIVYRKLILLMPFIQQNGYNYETTYFQEKLDRQLISLDYTKIVIKNIIDIKCEQEPLFRRQIINNNNKALKTIYNYIVINTISNISEVNTEICPETLLMDIKRLIKLQKEFKYIIISSVILTQLFHYLSSNNLDLDILKIIGNYLLSENNNIKYDKLLLNIYDLILLENKKDLEQILINCNNNNNIINKLFIKNLGNYYNSLLLNNNTDYNYVINAKILAPRIKKSIPLLSKIINITKNVHHNYYNKIINEIVTIY